MSEKEEKPKKTPKPKTALEFIVTRKLFTSEHIDALDFLREIRKGLKIKLILEHDKKNGTLDQHTLDGLTIGKALAERSIFFEPFNQNFEHALLTHIINYTKDHRDISPQDEIRVQKKIINTLYKHLSFSTGHETAKQTLDRYFPTLFQGKNLKTEQYYYCLKHNHEAACLKGCQSILANKDSDKQLGR